MTRNGPLERTGIGDVVIEDLAGLEVDAVAIDELDLPRLQAMAAHIFQASGLEALNKDGSVLRVEAVVLDDLDQSILERVAAGRAAAIGDSLGIVPGRILGLD